MRAFMEVYKEYMKIIQEFDTKILKAYFVEQDLAGSQTKNTLKRKLKQLQMLIRWEYGFKKDYFSFLKSTNNKKYKEQDIGVLGISTVNSV